MTDEPTNQTLLLLREIRAKQDEHTAKLDDHTRRLDELAREAKLAKSTLRFAVGSAGVAEHQSMQAVTTSDEVLRRLDEVIAMIENGPAPTA